MTFLKHMETALAEAAPKKSPGSGKGEDICIRSPDAFLGRWLMSNKKSISDAAVKYWAGKYPYSGKAFRVDAKPPEGPHGAALTSWSRTIEGMQAWLRSMPGNKFGVKPGGMSYYSGKIKHGIDLAKMAKEEGMEEDYRDTIIAVEEVTPIDPIPFDDMKEVW